MMGIDCCIKAAHSPLRTLLNKESCAQTDCSPDELPESARSAAPETLASVLGKLPRLSAGSVEHATPSG